MQFETVKEALEFLYEISQAKEIITRDYQGDGIVNERVATAEDMREMMSEIVASIADLLGMSEIYLKEE